MSLRIPAEAFPPGEYIRDFMEARGWTQMELAAVLGRPFRLVNELLSGKKSITPETARGLAEAFDTSPELWMNLESAYRLARTEGSKGEVSRRAKLYEKFPIKDMVKRGWIEPGEDAEALEREVLRHFELHAIDDPISMPVAARKSADYSNTSPSVWAWVYRARQLAKALSASSYSPDAFPRLVADLKPIIGNPKRLDAIPKLLAGHGIRFVVVEHLPKSRIDGAVFWLDSESPVIALSLRFDRLDCFWHTLAHELGHIEQGDAIVLDDNLVGDETDRDAEKPESEAKADSFACELLVPPDQLAGFIRRVRPLYSKVKIIQFANQILVHPGIIVGQLQRRGEIKYSANREMLVKIRDLVISTTLTDGWGCEPLTR